MPHIILEYSSNLGDDAGLSHLLDRLHDALGDTESFESDRIKSRAVRTDTYHVGADRRGFVHATVLFSPGRPEALRRQVGRRLLDIMRSDAALGGPTSPPASRSGSSSRGCTSPSGIADQVACWVRPSRGVQALGPDFQWQTLAGQVDHVASRQRCASSVRESRRQDFRRPISRFSIHRKPLMIDVHPGFIVGDFSHRVRGVIFGVWEHGTCLGGVSEALERTADRSASSF